MKTLFTILLFLATFSSFSQTKDDNKPIPTLGPYFWTVRVPMTEVDIEGEDTETPAVKKLSIPHQYFEIIEINQDENYAIITISRSDDPVRADYYNFKAVEPLTDEEIIKLDNKKEPDPILQENHESDGWGKKINKSDSASLKIPAEEVSRRKIKKSLTRPLFAENRYQENDLDPSKQLRYFKVPLDLIQLYATKNTYNPLSFEFGLVNFPFKYRLAKARSSFNGSFNFGAALGFNFRKKSYKTTSFSFITGYSVSSTTLETSDVRRNMPDLAETNDFTSISFSAGPMIENNRVQLGLFLGFDFLGRLNQDRYGWHHQGKPWFSIGFGYTIFSKQEEKASNSTNP
ncbi:hypothetical protein [Dyadobacter crusticola]|uniref:hypothetical protein n=1 Tax=Dyadobacter crusticola TaxID=292407 RepID=UPI0004E1981A|nr:hypothetical protein [Dyadobacter crusticola]